jgi:hypothetical protein
VTIRFPDDAILPPTGTLDTQSARLKPAAFLPIAVAVAGVLAILVGGISAHDAAGPIDKSNQIDPVVTGSIQPIAFSQMSPADQRRTLEMLDQ